MLLAAPRVDQAVEMQASKVGGASHDGERRMIEGFVSRGVSEFFDGELLEGSTVLRSDVGAKGIECRRVIESKDVAAIKNGISLSVDLTVKSQEIGD